MHSKLMNRIAKEGTNNSFLRELEEFFFSEVIVGRGIVEPLG